MDSVVGTVIIVILVIFGIVIGAVMFKDYYHDDLCQERFIHAEIAADSLVIIQDDKFCLKVLER